MVAYSWISTDRSIMSKINLTEYARQRYKDKVIIKSNYLYKLNLLAKECSSNNNILELGCGDGILTEILRKNNKVTSIDLEKGDIHWDLQNGLPAVSQKGKFDIVIASELIEHIWDNQFLLSHIHKALKYNGKLILSTPNLCSLGRRLMMLIGENPYIENFLYPQEAGHVKYYTFKDFKYLLENNNFTVKKMFGDIVMFTNNNLLWSPSLAKLFPSLSRCIIAICKKS